MLTLKRISLILLDLVFFFGLGDITVISVLCLSMGYL